MITGLSIPQARVIFPTALTGQEGIVPSIPSPPRPRAFLVVRSRVVTETP